LGPLGSGHFCVAACASFCGKSRHSRCSWSSEVGGEVAEWVAVVFGDAALLELCFEAEVGELVAAVSDERFGFGDGAVWALGCGVSRKGAGGFFLFLCLSASARARVRASILIAIC
jgi:hypothetical protein